MRQMYAIFYAGWPGQGIKALASTEDKARDLIDVLIERGEAARGVRFDSQLFAVVPVPLNAAEIGGVVIPLWEREAVSS